MDKINVQHWSQFFEQNAEIALLMISFKILFASETLSGILVNR